MYNFLDLQSEVKRRATRDQAGTTYDTAIKNIINTSLFRLARECPWRPLRRKASFDTVASYVSGTTGASATTSSTTVNIIGATFLADKVQVDRKIKLGGSSTYFYVENITAETSLVLDQSYNASSATNMAYEILPQEEYNLPVQAGHRMFMWHEDYGYPYKLQYVTAQDFYNNSIYITTKGTPTHYRMWGEDMILSKPLEPSVMAISSNTSADKSIDITVFGAVSGYPDYEIIVTDASDGTTKVSGSKSFTSVERIVKSSTSTGRISVTSNSDNNTVAILPVGDTTAGIFYKKVQLYPLPIRSFPIYVQYYKDPYRLVNSGDIHELGADFDEAIILLSTAKVKAEDNQKEADRFFALYADEVRTLRRTNMDKIDWFPTLRRPRESSKDALVANNLLYCQVGSQYGRRSR